MYLRYRHCKYLETFEDVVQQQFYAQISSCYWAFKWFYCSYP